MAAAALQPKQVRHIIANSVKSFVRLPSKPLLHIGRIPCCTNPQLWEAAAAPAFLTAVPSQTISSALLLAQCIKQTLTRNQFFARNRELLFVIKLEDETI